MEVGSDNGIPFVDMDNDTTRARLYDHYLSFFLPEGMSDFFKLAWMETVSLAPTLAAPTK